jgi:hypothetical protein
LSFASSGEAPLLLVDRYRAGTSRVTGFEISDSVLRLQVRQGIARNPIVITLVRSMADALERAGFLKLLSGGLQDLDPNLRVLSANSGEHRSSHGSTGYARLVLDRSGAKTLVVGVSGSETQPTIDGIVEVASGLGSEIQRKERWRYASG